jgi:hypothetical protein
VRQKKKRDPNLEDSKRANKISTIPSYHRFFFYKVSSKSESTNATGGPARQECPYWKLIPIFFSKVALAEFERCVKAERPTAREPLRISLQVGRAYPAYAGISRATVTFVNNKKYMSQLEATEVMYDDLTQYPRMMPFRNPHCDHISLIIILKR